MDQWLSKQVEVITSTVCHARMREEFLNFILVPFMEDTGSSGMIFASFDRDLGETVIEFAVGDWAAMQGNRIAFEQGGKRLLVPSKTPVISDWENNHPVFSERNPDGEDRVVVGLPLVCQDENLGSVWLLREKPLETTDSFELMTVSRTLAMALFTFELQRRNAWADALAQKEILMYQGKIQELEAQIQKRDEFVANISHELRSPISSMALCIYGIGKKPQDTQSYMDLMKRDLGRMEHILENMLMLSKLDNGQTFIKPSVFDLDVMCNCYILDRKLVAQNREIDLTYIRSSQPAIVQADRALIEQVLGILLSNALSYTQQGGKVIVRPICQSETVQSWVGFEVKDTGLGISLEDQKRIFTRFYRGDAAWKSCEHGSGLGLSIAREIFNQHHGRIDLFSEGIEGHGSTFQVWLPAEPARIRVDQHLFCQVDR
jgi:signal transduction histidine kinase